MESRSVDLKKDRPLGPPKITVASILRRYNHHWLPTIGIRLPKESPISRHAVKPLRLIPLCRTGALGSHGYGCGSCGHQHARLSSCGNRHCPSCSGRKRHQWRDRVIAWALACKYLHTVFTLPHELNDLMHVNQREMYGLLFRCVKDTLQNQAAKHYECKLGLVLTLHTWGQRLNQHVHMHVVMTSGGLHTSGDKWVNISATDPAMDTKELAAQFKKTYLRRLKSLLKRGKLRWPGPDAPPTGSDLSELATDLFQKIKVKPWMVDCQASPAECVGTEAIVNYLAAYVAGAAIGNHRLISDDGQYVTFRIKDYKNGKPATERMTGAEFVKRLSYHILPNRLSRVRYAGLFQALGRTERLAKCRDLIDKQADECPSGFRDSKPSIHFLSGELGVEVDEEQPVSIYPAPGVQICRKCQKEMELTGEIKPALTVRMVTHATAIVALMMAGSKEQFERLLEYDIEDKQIEDFLRYAQPLSPWHISLIRSLVEQQYERALQEAARDANADTQPVLEKPIRKRMRASRPPPEAVNNVA